MSLTSEHELTSELLELEQQLQSLVPSSVSQDLFVSMEQSMNNAGGEASSIPGDFDNLEVHLEQMAPASMPMDMLDRMERAMDRWHEQVPVEEKVVQFGEDESELESTRKQSGGGMLAAAAAVAMLGAVTALVMPHLFKESDSNINTPIASNHDVSVDSQASVVSHVEPRDAWLVPDSLSHNVTNTSDRGVVLSDDNIPHRCIQVDYVDRVKVMDDEGREFEIKRPGVRYMLLPVETN